MRDLFGELCKDAWGNVATELIITEDDSPLRGEMVYRGVRGAQNEVLFDIRVIDTDALSYVTSNLSSDGEENKMKYLS